MLKPFLACDADLRHVAFPVYVQPKIDGVRALNIGGKFVGRSLKPFANTKLVEYFSQPIFNCLDGELVVGSMRDSKTCRRTTSGTNTIDGPPGEHFYYYVFDDLSALDAVYSERMMRLQARVEHINSQGYDNIFVVSPKLAHSPKDVMESHELYTSIGFEGTILRDPNGRYKNGRATAREAAFLRIKDFHDAEALVLSIEEGEENLNEAKTNELGYTERSSHKENKRKNGMLGRMICEDLSSGDTITVAPGKLTHDERKFYWQNPDQIVGKMIKYKAMSYGKKDKPRFPTFQVFRTAVDMPS